MSVICFTRRRRMRTFTARSASIAAALCVFGLATVPSAYARIDCVPNVQYPHNSTHVPGTVNVVVTVNCTAAVPEIHVTAGLYRDGWLVSQTPWASFVATSFAKTNAAVPCQDGTYQGWMDYDITWPDNYLEIASPGPGYGPAVPITCGYNPPPDECEAPRGDPSMTCTTSAAGQWIEGVDNSTTAVAAPTSASASEGE